MGEIRFKQEIKEGKRKHRKNILQLEKNSEIKRKLEKLYELNVKNKYKVNDNLMKMLSDEQLLFTAYDKLKGNVGSMTPGTLDSTADEMNIERIQKISKELKEGTFKWTDVRRIMIPKPGKKKKRPLGIPNFDDRIVQEAIRIMLNIIYEPVFQEIEANHGFRPMRGTFTAILKLQRESKEMISALEGDITGAYDNVNHKKMIEILKKKISDKKFLKLITEGLKQSINFEGKQMANLVGTPQGGIASPILFNIYMHEFDMYVKRKLEEIAKNKNELEERTDLGKITRETRRLKSRIEKAIVKIKRIRTEKRSEQNHTEIRRLIDLTRKSKKRILQIAATKGNSKTIRFAYSRYADDFIIMTNAKMSELEKVKEHVTKWLKDELHFTLDQEKTLLTDLNKNKAKYLGFTIFRKEKRIIRKITKGGKMFRQRSTVELTLGIDHDRVKNRLTAGKIINDKHQPIANTIYMQMAPYQIVTKYRQRIEGLFNYYYPAITYPAELNFYYYVYKFSCLKTLARRMKKSIKLVTMTYGERILIESHLETKYKSSEKKKSVKKETYYPTYKEIHEKGEKLKEKTFSKIFLRMKELKTKSILTPLTAAELISYRWSPEDPFDMSNIAVNLRSAYQLKTHCSVCGIESNSGTKIEQHHLKHVRKGRTSGFAKIMRDLNRKTIPVCQDCHRKIHLGQYDGVTLKEIYDSELILS